MTLTMTTITTLPQQNEVDSFLKEYFNLYPQDAFYISMLVERAAEYFEVDPADAELKPEKAHGNSSGETTFLEQFVHWGCVHLLAQGIIKRTGPNEYQNIKGPKSVWKVTRVSKKLLGEAMVSVKILKDLKWEPERIMCELHQWSDDVIEAAIQKVFYV